MSPDGATVLARSVKELGAYDTTSGMLRWQVRASGDEEWRGAVFSGDGQFVMIKGARSALIVSTASGATIKPIPSMPGSEGRLVLLNGERYALGNEMYPVGEGQERTLPFREIPSKPSRLPVVSASGRYVAGTLQSHESEFAIVDVSREIESVKDVHTAGFSLDGKYVVCRWWLAGFPEPTRHPITLDGVLEETNLTAREWEKMGVTAAAVATCPEAALGPPRTAAPSK